jgi:hypothetical protein
MLAPSEKPVMKAYLTKEQILEQIQALPKKSKYLTREEIKQRMSLARELGLLPRSVRVPKYSTKSVT